MSGLKQLRDRVKSIKSTQKITKAMHVVSSAKLKKAKDQVKNINHYTDSLRDIMRDIARSDSLADIELTSQRFFCNDLSKMPHLMVVITSDRGLCGSFNSGIIKKVRNDIKNLQNSGKTVKLLIVGDKGVESLTKEHSSIIEKTYNYGENSIYSISLQIKDEIIELVTNGKIGSTDLYYNKFKNVITQISTKAHLLPVRGFDKEDIDGTNKISEYEYEGEHTIHDAINLYVNGQINCSSKRGFICR